MYQIYLFKNKYDNIFNTCFLANNNFDVITFFVLSEQQIKQHFVVFDWFFYERHHPY